MIIVVLGIGQDVLMSRAARFLMKVRACHLRHDVPNVLQKRQLTFAKEANLCFSRKLLLMPAYKEGCLRDYSCFHNNLAKGFYCISHAQPQPRISLILELYNI